MNKYLEATRNYRQYDGEDDGEMNMDDYEEVEMEEEKPKSVSLMEARSVPLQVTLRKKTHSTNRMFCGFRSRWTMPCAWQYCTADTRQRVICCASDSVNCCRCLM